MTKEDVISQMAAVAEQVQSGKIPPMQGYVFLYEIRKSADQLIKAIQDDAIDYAESRGKDVEEYGYRINVRTRTNFNYKHSESFLQKQKELDNIKAQMRYKTKHPEMEIVNEDGEIVEPAEIKYTTYLNLEYSEDE